MVGRATRASQGDPGTAGARARDFPLEPPLDFLQDLWRLNHALERISLAMERSLGVTAQQRLLLRCIGKSRDRTASQLAKVLHLDPGTVSAGLARLERKGLVARRRDPRDKRRVALRLTQRGRVLDRPAEATVEHVVERLLERTSAGDVSRVKSVLRRLAEDLDVMLGGSRVAPRGARAVPT